MSVVVAGLFDSELEASKAMDQLLNMHFDDMDTRVIDPTSRAAGGSSPIIPIVPNTGGGEFAGSTPGGITAGGAVLGGLGRDWLGNWDDVERSFYEEGVREGSSLAVVKVKDEDAARVRQLLHDYGARTYVKD